MIYAEKGNRVHRIEEQDIQKYVSQGYKITDGKCTVLKETVPTDVPTLRLEYTRHKAAIESLTAQVNALTAENVALKAELESIKSKANTKPIVSEDTEDTPEVSAPRRSRSKKT